MTGFGTAEREVPGGRLRLELKTVNHRFLNIRFRLPRGFEGMEPRIREWLGERFSRGHVSYDLSYEEGAGTEEPDLELDLPRARRILALLRELGEELALPDTVDLGDLLRFEGIVRERGTSRDVPEVDGGELEALTAAAAADAVAMREDEGRRLAADMAERVEAMAAQLDIVEERAPERLVRERDRLRESVRELADDVEVDEERLAREIAYLAEKWDINEEIVRFRSHLEGFREALATDPEVAVGKRLGFLVQEMHREANTIGAKANDPGISTAAVAMKEEIERLREQVENVE